MGSDCLDQTIGDHRLRLCITFIWNLLAQIAEFWREHSIKKTCIFYNYIYKKVFGVLTSKVTSTHTRARALARSISPSVCFQQV